MSKYGVISGPYFPVFRLNTEIYSVNLFSPNTGKYGPKITPYLNTFHAVYMIRFLLRYHCSGCNFVYCKFVSYIDIAEFHGVVNYQRKIIEKFTATLNFPDSCTNVYNNKSEYRM